jgi:hypothetical protein
MRRAARKDRPAGDIVGALEAVGASVAVLEPRPEAPGIPDLLVGYQGKNFLLELKAPGESLSAKQASWHACWRGDKPYTVFCASDALAAIGALPGAEPEPCAPMIRPPAVHRMVPAVRRYGAG